MRFSQLLRQPSAFVPLLLSACALATVLVHLALYGVTRGGDEGAAARLFQLLLAVQALVACFFAVKWLPRAPGPAAGVLALQVGAALAALLPVIVLEM